jgi:tmRNA-binding protein
MYFQSSNFKLFVLTLLSLLCFTETDGQSLQNIYNGYVITIQNDTLQGEIDVVSPKDAQSPSSIGFRKKTDYNFKKYYLASELKKVYLFSAITKDTLIFHSKNISINFSERLARQFNPTLPNTRKDTTLFLRAFTLGKVNLYYFEEASGSPYYFVEKNGQKIEVLIDEIEKVTGRTDVKNLDFRNQLYQLLNDCPTFNKNTFNKVSLSANSLIKLISTYNDKMQSTTPHFIVAQTVKSRIGHGLMLGANQSIVKQHSWVHHTTSITPSVGAWFSFNIVKKIPLSFSGEIEYATFQTNADRTRSVTVLHYYDSLSVKLNYIRANASLRYDYAVFKKAQLYVKMGGSYGKSIKTTINQTSYSYDELQLKTYKLFGPEIRTYDLSLLSAIGVQQKKILLELRYRLSNGYSSTEMIRTSIHYVSLNVLWNFAKNKLTIKSHIKEK